MWHFEWNLIATGVYCFGEDLQGRTEFYLLGLKETGEKKSKERSKKKFRMERNKNNLIKTIFITKSTIKVKSPRISSQFAFQFGYLLNLIIFWK